MRLSTIFLALFTLIAFAANSILCRQALMTHSIGPVAFTTIRLGAGMAALLPLIVFRDRLFRLSRPETSADSDLLKIKPSNFRPAIALFCYALFFSLAYIQLDAGVGALILFASVQMSMMGISLLYGNKVTLLEWAGLVIALSGLVYLLLPGLTAPPMLGAAMMVVSGVSWGVYSLLGQHQRQPVLTTARNFLFCLPGIMILLSIVIAGAVRSGSPNLSSDGVFLAIISGAPASGMGYVLWYLTVRRITTTVASVSQLAVPIIAAIGGMLFLNESLSTRLVVASVLIVSGIVITIVGRRVPATAVPRAQLQESN